MKLELMPLCSTSFTPLDGHRYQRRRFYASCTASWLMRCDAFSVILKPVIGPDSRNSGKLTFGFSRIKEATLSLSKTCATCWELTW